MSSVNVTVQALVFLGAMMSLSQQRDYVSSGLVAVCQTIGFLLLLDGATSAAWARHMAFHLDHDLGLEPDSDAETGPDGEAESPVASVKLAPGALGMDEKRAAPNADAPPAV